MTEVQYFDPEIKGIEDEVIARLMNSSLVMGRGEFTSKIIFYFITRKILTQRALQELTGFSAGKISQEVNSLVKMGLIDVMKRSSKGEIIYSMESIQAENFRRGNILIETSLNWEDKLMSIMEELESDREKLKDLVGYDKIKAIINQELNIIERRKRFIDTWEKLRLQYEAGLKE